jgi:cytochrome c oxidase assembly protein subunit 15
MSHQSASAETEARQRQLAIGFAVLAGLTLCLIIVGALVRAHDAGLACPDWPLCTGKLVPEFDLKIAFEWGHRLFAGLVSLGLLGLSVLVLRDATLRARMRVRLVLAWGVLGTQVIFGALTVWLLLAPWTVSMHLILGNTFCVILLWISRDLAEDFHSPVPERPVPSPVGALVCLGGLSLVLQIVLGGLVSSHYAGLACADFPTCDGQHFVPTLQGALGFHVLHRLNGYLLVVVFSLLAFSTRETGRLGRLAALACGLVWLQVAIGVTNVLLRLPYAVTGLHTGVAAAIVLTTALTVREFIHARSATSTAGDPHATAGRSTPTSLGGVGPAMRS